jgi:hypothetical protein
MGKLMDNPAREIVSPSPQLRIQRYAVPTLRSDLLGPLAEPVGNGVDATLLAGDVLGHDDVARTLGQFIVAWEQRLDELAGHIRQLTQEAATELGRYEQVDAEQGRAFASLHRSQYAS